MGEQTVPTDHRGLRILGLDECLQRVAAAPMGRIAFGHDGELVVRPGQPQPRWDRRGVSDQLGTQGHTKRREQDAFWVRVPGQRGNGP